MFNFNQNENLNILKNYYTLIEINSKEDFNHSSEMPIHIISEKNKNMNQLK
jgi:hypothetical protein